MEQSKFYQWLAYAFTVMAIPLFLVGIWYTTTALVIIGVFYFACVLYFVAMERKARAAEKVAAEEAEAKRLAAANLVASPATPEGITKQ